MQKIQHLSNALLATILISLFSYTMALASERTFYHSPKGDWNQSHPGSYVKYIATNGEKWSAKLDGNTFIHAPAGDWSRSHRDSIINYQGWDGSSWTAKVNGNTFTHAPAGNFKKAHDDVILNYKSWDGSGWTLTLDKGQVIKPGKMSEGVAYVFINEKGAGGLGHIGGAFQFEDGNGQLKFMCFATENKGGSAYESASKKGFWYQIVDDRFGLLQLFESKNYTAYKMLKVKNVDPLNAYYKMIANSKLDYNVVSRNCQNDVYDVLHDENSGYGITANSFTDKIYIGWVQSPPTPKLWFYESIGANAMGSL